MTAREQTLANALARVAEALAGELDLDRVLHTVVQVAGEVTGARYVALGVIGSGTYLVRFVQHGLTDEEEAAIGHYPTGKGLLGELIHHPEVIRLDRLQSHPSSVGFPPNHPRMETFLGAPVRSLGRVFGNLYLTEKDGGFTPTDEEIVQLLASMAGISIANAELAEQLRTLAVQNERDRISRDLHDGVIQTLFSIGMSLEGARGLVHSNPARVDERLDSAVEAIDLTIREIRNTIFTLRPGQAAEMGLERGLVELAREYEVNAILRPTLTLTGELDARVDEGLVPDVLFIAREALSNAAKHAAAQEVSIRAAIEEGQLLVEITDRGTGFDTSAVTPGHGLGNMAERATLLGADLDITSVPGEGTRVCLRVPLGLEEADTDE